MPDRVAAATSQSGQPAQGRAVSVPRGHGRDYGQLGNTQVRIDAYTGAAVGLDLPTDRSANETLTTWIEDLHPAAVLRSRMRIVITFAGMGILMLNRTGLLIYLRKRSAAARSAAMRG